MIRYIKILALLALVGMMAPSLAMAQLAQDETEAALETIEENSQVESAGTLRTLANRAGQAVKSVIFQGLGWFNIGGALSPDNVVTGRQIVGTDDHSDLFDGVGVWFNGSHEFLRFDQTDFRAETSISSAIIGADKFIYDDILLGFALARSSTDTTNQTDFAAGTQTAEIGTTSTTGTIYGAYIFNENIYFDASFGVTRDRIRTNAFGNAASAFKQSGNTRFGAVNAYYIQPYADDLIVTYQAGVSRSVTFLSSFKDEILVANAAVAGTASNSTQYTLGGQASHLFDSQTILNGGAAIEYFGTSREIGLGRGVVGASGVANQQIDSRFQMRFTGGVDHALTDKLTLSGELGIVTFREDSDNWNAGLNIRYDF